MSRVDDWTWAATTTDPRALQSSSGSSRRATTWSDPASFTIDVDLTDGKTHVVSLYMVDWNANGRSQRIELIDSATGRTLDSRDVSNFVGGTYLSWNVAGKVQFRITRTGGPNAVVSGIFFD